MKSYKIYVIGTRGIPNVQGGVETHCEEIYPFLQCRNFDITLFARKRFIPKSKRTRLWKGIRIKYFWAPRNRYFESFVHTLLCIIYTIFNKPDLVHIHNIGPGFFVPCLNLFKIKSVVTHHSKNYEHEKWNYPARVFLRICEKISIRKAGRVITVSETHQSELYEKFKRSIVLIPNGIKIPERKFKTDILLKHNLENHNYILFVGRITPEKGINILFQAFLELLSLNEGNNYSDWKLVIVGKADNLEEYNKYLREIAGQSENIIFTGYLNKEYVHDLYESAKLFILPSYNEGCSLSLLEALSHKIPCLVSDIPENKSFGKYKVRFFKVGNSEDLKIKFQEILPRLLKPGTKEDFIHSEEILDWYAVSELIEKEYMELLK
ncbi:MAG: glycosyltransferase family 4 protein [Bacteroidales bacterium]|nr:glycosyltransferase family 4 protein [Bacteroidales bacterium]